jgi:hypothetical protein
LLTDRAEATAIAARVFLWRQAEETGELATGVKAVDVADERGERRVNGVRN